MYEYIYKNPTENGYTQFKISKQQHNKLFKRRQIRWFSKYEYYYNEDCIIMHEFHNIRGVIAETLLFPLKVLFEGLGDLKECIRDLKSNYNQKKSGTFSSDHMWCTSDSYKEIMKIIKK